VDFRLNCGQNSSEGVRMTQRLHSARNRMTKRRSESPTASNLHDLPYAVVDLETTGFSPALGDRIVEVAILRMTETGDVEDEWGTLVNPLRDVGPTHVHGIAAEDVSDAPTFIEIIGDVLQRLDRAVFVAHNARFDHDFLAAELSMAGVFLPAIPCLCTLSLASRLNPRLTNHKLSACCDMAGLVYDGFHSALEDARLDARLLLVLLGQAEAAGMTTLQSLGCEPVTFPIGWPTLPTSGRRCARHGEATPEVPFLARMVASMASVKISGERVAPYLDVLDRVVADRMVTEAEADALKAMAEEWKLSREEVMSAHEGYLESLIEAAVADGRVTEVERRDLEAVTRLLSIDPTIMRAMLLEARRARDKGPVLRQKAPRGG
jgi:DNA polymerase III epsilon subunit-like protein